MIKRCVFIFLIIFFGYFQGFCDPFKDLSPSPFEYDYIKAIQKIKIRGLFKGERETIGVFETEDNNLKLMRLNDKLEITIDEIDYCFTLKSVSDSGAVFKGKNGNNYNVWINSEIKNDEK